ncbi:MAG TPA: hypothetical protein VH369_18745 [Bryobacteraceae bacterium]|jgi:hypothetical protein
MAFLPLYDKAYLGSAQNIYRQIRTDTYDFDLGQTDWMNARNCGDFCRFWT